jgi:sec-independent protein translocase protein TatA
MPNLGPTELIVIAVIAILLFGGSRLAEVGKGLGQGIRNFKQGLKDPDEQDSKAAKSSEKSGEAGASNSESSKNKGA